LNSVNPGTHSGDSRWRPRTNAVMRKHAGGWRRSQVSKRGHGRAPPRRARRSACQRPERKAREQGLNPAWRELPELVSLHTVQLGRCGVFGLDHRLAH
jgi:hypothetical protein